MEQRYAGFGSRSLIALIATIAAIMLSSAYSHPAGATEPDKTPPVVTLSGTAVKAVEEGKTTGTYELHIVGTDGSKAAPQSGIAKIEVGVDGSGQQSWEKSCPEGSCGLEEKWTYSPTNYSSEGPRWITVKVTDHAGNATEEEISLEGVEEVPREAAPTGPDKISPTITLAGSAEKAVWQGASSGKYELRMFATDGSPSAPQSGVSKIEVAVDGTTVQSWEKYCPIGSCRLMVAWPYSPGTFSGTHHYVTVTVRDHAGNVATKKIEWDPTPPVASGSGELKTLENQYINGQGSKTVVISATDNHSGVRLLSLEDEGQGILVSKTPAACVLKPLKDEECPLKTSETLTVDTSKMPEGANHLKVVAEDFAGNVTHGGAWTVYVDRRSPIFDGESPLVAISLPGVELPVVSVPEATDPALADGSPGSGVAAYWFRYSIGSGPLSGWTESPGDDLELPGAGAGSEVTVEAYAVDRVGNESGIFRGTTTVLTEEGSVPVSPEETQEEDETPGQLYEFGAIGKPSGGSKGVRPEAEKELKEICHGEIPYPHFSSHAKAEGKRRVNALMTVSCGGDLPVVEGFGVNFLIFRGEVVSMSKIVPFEGIKVFERVSANEACRTKEGQYWAKGVIYAAFPPGAIPIGEATGNPEVKVIRSAKVGNPCIGR